jgi:hypothetical protein
MSAPSECAGNPEVAWNFIMAMTTYPAEGAGSIRELSDGQFCSELSVFLGTAQRILLETKTLSLLPTLSPLDMAIHQRRKMVHQVPRLALREEYLSVEIQPGNVKTLSGRALPSQILRRHLAGSSGSRIGIGNCYSVGRRCSENARGDPARR